MCTCHSCGEKYKIDLILPDVIWELIKPENKEYGSGLLCGSCIMKRLEKMKTYGKFFIDIKLEIECDNS
jgi:hypothetical protein